MGYIAVIVHLVTFDPNFHGTSKWSICGFAQASEASLMAGPTPSYLEEDAKTQQAKRGPRVFSGGTTWMSMEVNN